MINSDIPRRFKLVQKEIYGVFFPSFGEYIIISEERGIEEFTGCPEEKDVVWLDK